MAAANLTFGVELEVTLPAALAGVVTVGRYHRGVQVNDLPHGWTAEHDGSIDCKSGYFGVEIVSPVLKGADGLRQIQTVCEWLNRVGAVVNVSTGFHVHVGFDRTNTVELHKLVALVARQEKAIYASTGTKSREENRFCKGVKSDPNYQAAFKGKVAAPVLVSNRYHVLNVVSQRPTVEFRAFAGTTNATKAIAHVLTCLGLVEKAADMKRVADWETKTPVPTSGKIRGGEGLSALNRLFYDLGWTKGRQAKTYGELSGEGLPTIKEVKAELVRLATKYDERA